MENFFNNDPMLSSMRREQGQIIEEYKRRVETQGTRTPIWDKIDAEMTSLTDKQKEIVFKDEDYVAVNNELSVMVQTYLLNLVKPQIESNDNGRKMLEKVYDTISLAKKKAVNETDKKMKMFEQFEIYSASNPDVTYSEFLKSMNKKK